MTKYESSLVVVSGVSLVIAFVAVIMNLVVWRTQRRLQVHANDLQRATSELAKKQLDILVREEQGQNKARLSTRSDR